MQDLVVPDGPEQSPDDPAADADGRAEQEAALSGDEPLPARYQLDQIGLMVQGPDRLYLYWRFAHDPIETLHRLFGEQVARFRPAIKLVETESEAGAYYDAAPSGEYWFNELRPGRGYRAEVGWLAPGGPFISLLRSEPAYTPRGSVAAAHDETPAVAAARPQLGHAPGAPGRDEAAPATPPAAEQGTTASTSPMNYTLSSFPIEPPEVF